MWLHSITRNWSSPEWNAEVIEVPASQYETFGTLCWWHVHPTTFNKNTHCPQLVTSEICAIVFWVMCPSTGIWCFTAPWTWCTVALPCCPSGWCCREWRRWPGHGRCLAALPRLITNTRTVCWSWLPLGGQEVCSCVCHTLCDSFLVSNTTQHNYKTHELCFITVKCESYVCFSMLRCWWWPYK